MDMKNLAVKAAELRILADVIASEQKQVRAALDQQMETTGASRVEASLPDGTKIATATRPRPRPKPAVVDEEAFTGWVRQHRPAEVATRVVRQVRPAYRRKLLAEIAKAGEPRILEETTGELVEVPGVQMQDPQEASHSLRLVDGADRAIVTALRSGLLTHLDLPQLTSGGES